MTRSLLVLLLAAALLSGCGLFKDRSEAQRKNWQAADWYKAAKEELDNGNWQAATKLYAELESKFPYGRYAQQAQLDSAYAFYKEGETAQAVSAIDRFLKAYPNHPFLDYALYLKGLANFREDLGPLATYVARQDFADRDPKAARESFEIFKDLVTRFPESRYAPDAYRRMGFLVDALARHEMHVARYYLNRGAWLSAANRAQTVLTRFPTSSARQEALDILVQAYDRMGLAALRDDARRVLALNHPTDPLAKEPKGGWFRWLPWSSR